MTSRDFRETVIERLSNDKEMQLAMIDEIQELIRFGEQEFARDALETLRAGIERSMK